MLGGIRNGRCARSSLMNGPHGQGRAAMLAKGTFRVHYLAAAWARSFPASYSIGMSDIRLIRGKLSEIIAQKVKRNRSGQQECEKGIHRLNESQREYNHNVKKGEYGKGITEGTMNHMPEMKHVPCASKKCHPLREGGLLPDQRNNPV